MSIEEVVERLLRDNWSRLCSNESTIEAIKNDLKGLNYLIESHEQRLHLLEVIYCRSYYNDKDPNPEFQLCFNLLKALTYCFCFFRVSSHFHRKYQSLVRLFLKYTTVACQENWNEKYAEKFYDKVEGALLEFSGKRQDQWSSLFDDLVESTNIGYLDALFFFSLMCDFLPFSKKLHNKVVLEGCADELGLTMSASQSGSEIELLGIIPKVLSYVFSFPEYGVIFPNANAKGVLSPVYSKKRVGLKRYSVPDADWHYDNLGKLKRFFQSFRTRGCQIDKPILYLDIDHTTTFNKGPIDLKRLMASLDGVREQADLPYSAVVIVTNSLYVRNDVNTAIRAIKRERKREHKGRTLTPLFGSVILGWDMTKLDVISSIHRDFFDVLSPSMVASAELVDDKVGDYLLDDVQQGLAIFDSKCDSVTLKDLLTESAFFEISKDVLIDHAQLSEFLQRCLTQSVLYRYNINMNSTLNDNEFRDRLHNELTQFGSEVNWLLCNQKNQNGAVTIATLQRSSSFRKYMSSMCNYFDRLYAERAEYNLIYFSRDNNGKVVRVVSPACFYSALLSGEIMRPLRVKWSEYASSSSPSSVLQAGLFSSQNTKNKTCEEFKSDVALPKPEQ